MRSRRWIVRIIIVGAVLGAVAAGMTAFVGWEWKSGLDWPEPKYVDPGPPGGRPADAIVLFDGKDLSQWAGGNLWTVENSCAIAGKASIHTRQAFGDCQLHLEWAEPETIAGSGQWRGNSGVIFMGLYEVQVLDSYCNDTYYDGQCAAVYKQHPPLVNVCRPPGQWQTYDIIFKSPRFDAQGKLLRPAYVTVLQNNVLVQDHYPLLGETSYFHAPRYQRHPPRLPLELQYHFSPVRFRNIWIRNLPEEQLPKQIGAAGMVRQGDPAEKQGGVGNASTSRS